MSSYVQSDLCDVIRRGFFRQVRFLVLTGSNVNARSGDGLSPLLYTVYVSDVDWAVSLARTLLEAGARLDQRDHHGRNAFHLAAAFGRTKLLRVFLLAADFNLNALDADGNTALHLAAAAGSLPCVRLMLEWLKRFRFSLKLRNNANETAVQMCTNDECRKEIQAAAESARRTGGPMPELFVGAEVIEIGKEAVDDVSKSRADERQPKDAVIGRTIMPLSISSALPHPKRRQSRSSSSLISRARTASAPSPLLYPRARSAVSTRFVRAASDSDPRNQPSRHTGELSPEDFLEKKSREVEAATRLRAERDSMQDIRQSLSGLLLYEQQQQRCSSFRPSSKPPSPSPRILNEGLEGSTDQLSDHSFRHSRRRRRLSIVSSVSSTQSTRTVLALGQRKPHNGKRPTLRALSLRASGSRNKFKDVITLLGHVGQEHN